MIAPLLSTESLIIERSESSLLLTLNRVSKRNSLSVDLVSNISTAVDYASSERIQRLVFKGNGPVFCGGFDLSGIAECSSGDILQRFVQVELMLQKVAGFSGFTHVYAHGAAIGAGADLFMACRTRLAADDTKFRFPGASFGLVLGWRRLISRIGFDAASEIIQSGRTVGAPEALKLGMATALCTPTEASEALSKEMSTRAKREVSILLPAMRASDFDDRSLADVVRSAMDPGFPGYLANYVQAFQKSAPETP